MLKGWEEGLNEGYEVCPNDQQQGSRTVMETSACTRTRAWLELFANGSMFKGTAGSPLTTEPWRQSSLGPVQL